MALYNGPKYLIHVHTLCNDHVLLSTLLHSILIYIFCAYYCFIVLLSMVYDSLYCDNSGVSLCCTVAGAVGPLHEDEQ